MPNIGTELAERRLKERGEGGSGGGDDGTMGLRVGHIETRMTRLEDKIDTVLRDLAGVASKADMRNYLLLSVAAFIALAAALVSGLGWLETRASRVETAPAAAPVVIQMPSPVPLATPSPGPTALRR